MYSIAVYCFRVAIIRHFSNPGFVCTSLRLLAKIGQFLFIEVWLSQMFLFWLCLLNVRQLIHLYYIGDAVHYLSLWLPAQRAGFLLSAVAKPVVKSGAFKTLI